MIDIETEIFNSISVKVREKYSQIFLTGEYVKSPPSFPCASIVEVDNQIYRNTRTTECIENHAQLLYEVNVYSNKHNGKKAECKEIISYIDSLMASFGFTRTLLNPVPNEEDATVYRMVIPLSARKYTAASAHIVYFSSAQIYAARLICSSSFLHALLLRTCGKCLTLNLR